MLYTYTSSARDNRHRKLPLKMIMRANVTILASSAHALGVTDDLRNSLRTFIEICELLWLRMARFLFSLLEIAYFFERDYLFSVCLARRAVSVSGLEQGHMGTINRGCAAFSHLYKARPWKNARRKELGLWYRHGTSGGGRVESLSAEDFWPLNITGKLLTCSKKNDKTPRTNGSEAWKKSVVQRPFSRIWDSRGHGVRTAPRQFLIMQKGPEERPTSRVQTTEQL